MLEQPHFTHSNHSWADPIEHFGKRWGACTSTRGALPNGTKSESSRPIVRAADESKKSMGIYADVTDTQTDTQTHRRTNTFFVF